MKKGDYKNNLKEIGIDPEADPATILKQTQEECIDQRLYGGIVAVKKDKKKGKNTVVGEDPETDEKTEEEISRTGAVQYTMGESLHPVELNEDNNTVTRVMTHDNKKKGNAIGKDHRVYYALIGFNGTLSGFNAGLSGVSQEDVNLLDEANIKALELCKTRSKTGQKTRLYMRVEYDSQEVFLGPFSEYVEMFSRIPLEKVRSVKEYSVDITPLVNLLVKYKKRIKAIHLYKDPLFQLNYSNKPVKDLPSLFKENDIPVVIHEQVSVD